MLDKLHAIYERFMRLEEQLSDPSVASDPERFRKINKDYKDLKPIVEAYHTYSRTLNELQQAKSLLNDPEMSEFAKSEVSELQQQQEELETQIKLLIIPKDPEDSKNVLFEIRSGTGGDEASLFAGDLARMYQRYFDRKKWKTEIMEVSDGTMGGYNKIVYEIQGEEVYGTLKFESGAHRVQRVPDTETKGRVHTSAATVVVLPILEMEDVHIKKEDLRIDVFRASGAGGQHINKTESAVRITHLPTGAVSECQEGRSQHQNKEIAMQRLYNLIYNAQKKEHDDKIASNRRSLIGTGDRSDKIRTYNYPQNRLTDHRINLTLYSLEKVLEGEIDEVIESLILAENAEKLRGSDDE